MGQDSAIQWTHHTFNPWRGCTHVSPGCENCYAEVLAKRNPETLGSWGAGGHRAIAAESYWRQPKRWNRAAEKADERHRVFCASLADVFEDRLELVGPRARLFELIVQTPHLDWLLLTKRPEVARRMLEPMTMCHVLGEAIGDSDWPLRNVWIGVSVEDQRRADERIPVLLDTPAAVRFLSLEPLLGPVELRPEWLDRGWERPMDRAGNWTGEARDIARIGWLIVGGESGPRARPMDLAWARALVEQGRAGGCATFVKQLGKRPILGGQPYGFVHDSHGGDPDEWPADLRVREFPEAVGA